MKEHHVHRTCAVRAELEGVIAFRVGLRKLLEPLGAKGQRADNTDDLGRHAVRGLYGRAACGPLECGGWDRRGRCRGGRRRRLVDSLFRSRWRLPPSPPWSYVVCLERRLHPGEKLVDVLFYFPEAGVLLVNHAFHALDALAEGVAEVHVAHREHGVGIHHLTCPL